MTKHNFADQQTVEEMLAKIQKHFKEESNYKMWLATEGCPLYTDHPYIIGIKNFPKVTLHEFNDNPMMPYTRMQDEVIAQVFIVDVAPLPKNPKKLSPSDLYSVWFSDVYDNRQLKLRRYNAEKRHQYYYVYDYVFENIVDKLQVLGTRYEEGARVKKR